MKNLVENEIDLSLLATSTSSSIDSYGKSIVTPLILNQISNEQIYFVCEKLICFTFNLSVIL